MTVGKEAAKGAAKKRGLGRGLEALLGPKAAAEAPPLQAMRVRVSGIHANAVNSRTTP